VKNKRNGTMYIQGKESTEIKRGKLKHCNFLKYASDKEPCPDACPKASTCLGFLTVMRMVTPKAR
jgi:hypothetical protein